MKLRASFRFTVGGHFGVFGSIMAYLRFIVALLIAALLCRLGLSSFRDYPVFGPTQIAAPSPFNNEGLPPEAISETGGGTMYRADATRGVINIQDPSICIGS